MVFILRFRRNRAAGNVNRHRAQTFTSGGRLTSAPSRDCSFSQLGAECRRVRPGSKNAGAHERRSRASSASAIAFAVLGALRTATGAVRSSAPSTTSSGSTRRPCSRSRSWPDGCAARRSGSCSRFGVSSFSGQRSSSSAGWARRPRSDSAPAAVVLGVTILSVGTVLDFALRRRC